MYQVLTGFYIGYNNSKQNVLNLKLITFHKKKKSLVSYFSKSIHMVLAINSTLKSPIELMAVKVITCLKIVL